MMQKLKIKVYRGVKKYTPKYKVVMQFNMNECYENKEKSDIYKIIFHSKNLAYCNKYSVDRLSSVCLSRLSFR